MSKRKINKTHLAIIIVSSLLVFTLFTIFIYAFINLKPTKAFLESKDEKQTIVIENGLYDKEIINKLEQENIIKNSSLTYLYNRFIGKYSFYAGTYEIPSKIDNRDIKLKEILQYLSNPNNAMQLTSLIKLDEGDFAKSFAYAIASNVKLNDCDNNSVDYQTQALLEYWNDSSIIRNYMNEYPFLTEDIFNDDIKILLEGYLFPDSYEFYLNTTKDEVTRKILDRTLEIYNKHLNEFNNSKLSTHEIFTLASIVQWETGDAEDSLKVAGVFLNRIENPEEEWTGGRLQSTVTACYAFDLDKTECYVSGDTLEYTQTDNPYNTYTIEGFPPGPVCCPNEISINAALNPNQEDGYYYFVANMCEGGTVFSRTNAEHERNIDKYYLPCAE